MALDQLADAEPGTVTDTSRAGIDVATGEGVLRLTTVQPVGGRPMAAEAYLNARDLAGLRFDVFPS